MNLSGGAGAGNGAQCLLVRGCVGREHDDSVTVGCYYERYEDSSLLTKAVPVVALETLPASCGDSPSSGSRDERAVLPRCIYDCSLIVTFE